MLVQLYCPFFRAPRIQENVLVEVGRDEYIIGKAPEKLQFFSWDFTVKNGHVVLSGWENDLLEVFEAFGIDSYEARVEKDEVKYVIFDDVIVEFLGDGAWITSPLVENRLPFSAENLKKVVKDYLRESIIYERPSAFGQLHDYFFLPFDVGVEGRKMVFRARDKYTSFPSKYSVPMRGPVFELWDIRAFDEKKYIPFKPMFLRLPRRNNVFLAQFDVERIRDAARDAPFVIGGRVFERFLWENVKGRLILYLGPRNWMTILNNGVFFRVDDLWGKLAGDPYGLGRRAWETSVGYVYGDVVLPTGQGVWYLVIRGRRAVLHGVVTPEGVFSLEAPVERVFGDEPISVFDDGVKVLGTLLVFPSRIGFSRARLVDESDVFVKRVFLDIDDYRVELPSSVNEKTPSEVFNVSDDAAFLVEEFGFGVL